MRIQVFVLTYIAYTIMHSLRTAYSYSKTYFKVEYNFSPTYLAVLDSSIYLAMGVGFLLRYFFLNKKDIIFSYFTTGMAFIIAFALFPFLSFVGALDKSSAQWVSIILMIIYGFFQMNYWPVSFLVMTDYFTNEEDGCLIGVWTTAAGLGNILGYFFCGLLILNLHEPWQVPLFILVAILFFCNLFVYMLVKRPTKAKDQGYLEL
jgi:sugar phosphate permease